MSERTQRLKRAMLDAKPCVSAERLVLATEAYQKYAGLPIPVFRAKVLEYVLTHKKVEIRRDEMIVGDQADRQRCAPLFPEYQSSNGWLADEIRNLHTRTKDVMEVTPEDKEKILEYLPYWDGKSLEDITNAVIDEDIKTEEGEGVYTFGGRETATGHTAPNYKRLMKEGLRGYINRCKDKIAAVKEAGNTTELQPKVDFWNGSVIAMEAVITFAKRYAALAREMAETETDGDRKAELLLIAENCEVVPEHEPKTFLQALQFIWFCHVTFHIENNSTGNGFGRFDQYTYPYYKMDKEAGGITEEQATEYLEMLYVKITGMIKIRPKIFSYAYAGYPMWQILMCGGQDIYGNDATNDVSYLILEAADNIRMSQPAIGVRIHEGTPEKFMEKAVSMNQRGLSNPAFFNDKVAIPMVQAKGGTLEEARDWAIVGCVEPHPGQGSADGTPLAVYMNGGKIIELTMHSGYNYLTKRQTGPKTGDVTTFENRQQIIQAVENQLDYFYEKVIINHNRVISIHSTMLPAMFASDVMDDCIDNGKSVQQGGVRHNYTGAFLVGPANMADSIVAIDYAVFKDKICSMQELIDAMEQNFEGQERLRQYLLKVPPKFGNDIEEVDEVYREIVCHVAEFVQAKEDARGGYYAFSNLSQTANVLLGSVCGATPDGRLSKEPLSDNASPSMGRDTNGPTASVNSVAHSDQVKQWDGSLLNIRFDPKGVEGEKGEKIVEGVVKTYFENYGSHIQINVVNDKTLRAAQKDPEHYRDLLVRVAGYMAYFTEMDKDIQDSIIARTCHFEA